MPKSSLPNKSSRRKTSIAAVTVICGVALAIGLSFRSKVEIVINRASLQSRVDARLPFQGSQGPIRYTVTDAKINVRPDGRVTSDAVVSVQAMAYSANGHLTGSGVLSYKGGDFFINSFDLESASIHVGAPGSPIPSGTPRSSEEVRAAAARRHLAETVTHFTTGMQQAAEREVRDNGVAIIAAILDNYPIYTLQQDDFKQNMARLLIERVQVQNDNIFITLDTIKGKVAIIGWFAAALFILLGGFNIAAVLGWTKWPFRVKA